MIRTNGDHLFKGLLLVMLLVFPMGIMYICLLASKLEGYLDWTWWQVFSPMWIYHAIVLLASPFFYIYFPDRAFIEDRIGPSYGSSIKPRYRVFLLFCTGSVLNLPVALFNVFLCLHLQSDVLPWPIVFSPMFIAEILALFRM